MRFLPLNRHLKAALQALAIDDRPLRVAYARRAHWTVAMMRDRLAEPGDHLRPVWPDFEAYAAYVFANAQHSRLRDCRLLETKGATRTYRFAAIDDYDVVTEEPARRIVAVEFRPNTDHPASYRVELP